MPTTELATTFSDSTTQPHETDSGEGTSTGLDFNRSVKQQTDQYFMGVLRQQQSSQQLFRIHQWIKSALPQSESSDDAVSDRDEAKQWLTSHKAALKAHLLRECRDSNRTLDAPEKALIEEHVSKIDLLKPSASVIAHITQQLPPHLRMAILTESRVLMQDVRQQSIKSREEAASKLKQGLMQLRTVVEQTIKTEKDSQQLYSFFFNETAEKESIFAYLIRLLAEKTNRQTAPSSELQSIELSIISTIENMIRAIIRACPDTANSYVLSLSEEHRQIVTRLCAASDASTTTRAPVSSTVTTFTAASTSDAAETSTAGAAPSAPPYTHQH